MKSIVTVILLLTCTVLFAQSKVLSEEEFLAVLRKYHPVVRQAGLEVRLAEAELLESRGAFDPSIAYETGRKDFDGTRYYNRTNAEVKIPTWYGIDLYAGTEGNSGVNLNPEETRGEMTYLGFSLPVVRGLLMDRRRAVLQQARIYRDGAEFVRRSLLNDLVLDGLYRYWNWWEYYHTYQIIQGALQNAEQRFRLVKTAFEQGERAAIDTVEALTQVQTFAQQLSQAYADWQASRFELSAFLWTENETGYPLPEDAQPQPWRGGQNFALDTLLIAAASHPDLVQYNFKLNALQIERRLKFQELLPDVNLKYQQLGKGYDIGKPINNAWFDNNYRFGVSVYVPLFLRKGRGAYQGAKIKLEQTRLDQLNKRLVIENKVKSYFTEWQQLQQQVALQNSLVANFATLQRGEELRFLNGESSLFLINSRELKTLESRIKLVNLQAKSRKSAAGVQWAAGIGSF